MCCACRMRSMVAAARPGPRGLVGHLNAQACSWIRRTRNFRPSWSSPCSTRPTTRGGVGWGGDRYSRERHNELTFTGVGLDPHRIRSALDAALLAGAEVPLGQEGWAAIPDPCSAAPMRRGQPGLVGQPSRRRW